MKIHLYPIEFSALQNITMRVHKTKTKTIEKEMYYYTYVIKHENELIDTYLKLLYHANRRTICSFKILPLSLYHHEHFYRK